MANGRCDFNGCVNVALPYQPANGLAWCPEHWTRLLSVVRQADMHKSKQFYNEAMGSQPGTPDLLKRYGVSYQAAVEALMDEAGHQMPRQRDDEWVF